MQKKVNNHQKKSKRRKHNLFLIEKFKMAVILNRPLFQKGRYYKWALNEKCAIFERQFASKFFTYLQNES